VPETVVKPGAGVWVGKASIEGVGPPLPATGVIPEGPLPGVVVPLVVFPGVCWVEVLDGVSLRVMRI
jgi:hypothetical protein